MKEPIERAIKKAVKNIIMSTPETALAAIEKFDKPKSMIPHDQIGLFYEEESEAGRAYVLRWIAVLEPLRHTSGVTKQFPIVAKAMKDKTGNVKRRYYAYCKAVKGEGDRFWDHVINRTLFPKPRRKSLPASFLEFWKKRQEANRRLNDGVRQSHRDLLAQLDLWTGDPTNKEHKIPGYDNPPLCDSYCSNSRRYVPASWSYSNLINHKPRRVNKLARSQGNKAASALLPGNYKTRFGTGYLEVVFFDDVTDDIEVVSFANKGQSMRLEGFSCVDYLTGNFETNELQMRKLEESDGVKRSLNTQSFVWMVICHLMERGYRIDKRGTTFVFEHATASGYSRREFVDDDVLRNFDESLAWVSNNCILVDRSGRFDQSIFAQMLMRGKGRKGTTKLAAGNFRSKGPIESMFKLRHIITGSHIKGYIGNNYQVRPEDHALFTSYQKQLFKAVDQLSPERKEIVWKLLKRPFLDFDEASLLMKLVFDVMNRRDWHNLEGWAKCGFYESVYRIPSMEKVDGQVPEIPLSKFETLEDDQKQYLQTFGEKGKRVLSPAEAAARCRVNDRAHIAKLSPHQVLALVPVDWAIKVKVNKRGEIWHRDVQRFGPEPLIYLATIKGADSTEDLRPGSEFLGYLNPYRPAELILANMENQFRGVVELFERSAANNPHAILKKQGEINSIKARVRRSSERRHEDEANEFKEMDPYNQALIEGDVHISPEDLEAEKDRQALIEAAEFDNGDSYDPTIADELDQIINDEESSDSPFDDNLYGYKPGFDDETEEEEDQ